MLGQLGPRSYLNVLWLRGSVTREGISDRHATVLSN